MDNKDVLTGKQPDGTGQARALGLFLLKRYEEAAGAYETLLKKDPENIVFWVNRMICRLQYSALKASFFDEMIRRVNDLPSQGYLCLAEVLNGLDKLEEALVFVNRALERDPANTGAAVFKALLLIDLNRTDELYELMRSIYPRLKNDERVLSVMAFYASMFWNMRQSDYLLKKALKINRPFVLQNNLFYTVLLSIGKEASIPDFGAEALDFDPDNPEIWFALAQAYLRLGNDQEADRAFETLSYLTALSEELKIQWLRVLINLQKYDQAFDLLIDLPENREDLLLLLREMLQKMMFAGLTGKAFEYAEALKAKHKKSPEIRFICDMIMNKDRNEGCPLSLVRILNDLKAEEMWDATSDPSYRAPLLLEKMLDRLQVPVAGSLDVLDLGCGTGAMAAVLENYSRPSGSLTGVDVSPKSLDFAAGQKKYTTLKETDLVSFCRERENAKKYDVIVCMDVLGDFSDLTPAFKAVKAALKDDGVFVFSVLPLKENNLFFKFEAGDFYHSADYVAARLKSANLQEEYRQEALLFRKSAPCLIFAVRRKK